MERSEFGKIVSAEWGNQVSSISCIVVVDLVVCSKSVIHKISRQVLLKKFSQNRHAISYIRSEYRKATSNNHYLTASSAILLADVIRKTISIHEHINNLKQAMSDLVSGTLSPRLITPSVLQGAIRQVKHILHRNNQQFHLVY